LQAFIFATILSFHKVGQKHSPGEMGRNSVAV